MCRISKLLIIVTIVAIGAKADDIPYVFRETGGNVLDSSYVLEVPLELSEASTSSAQSDVLAFENYDSDIIEFTTASAPGSGQSENKSRTVSAIKSEVNDKVDVENSITRNAAVVIAAKYPGEYNIDQITSIYDYLKGGWRYVADPRGIDYYSPASSTLQLGKEAGCVGVGDCDDFAILMSALIESIGGTTRVILAYSQNSGHAYTEVYLGKLDDEGSHVKDIISWLKSEYNTKEIYTHMDSASKDVWLNLDWGEDEGMKAHPGGPFFKASKHKVLLIREQLSKVPPMLPKGYVGDYAANNGGILEGNVTDETGSPLISKILVTNDAGNVQTAVTNEEGHYRIGLQGGSYHVTAEKSGFDFEKISVGIRDGGNSNIPIHGTKEYEIETGVTLGEPYSWSDS